VGGVSHNISHGGLSFHVQTEHVADGEDRRIVSHVFFDGAIVSSVQADCKLDDGPDAEANLRRMIKRQHRELILDLTRGKLDDRISALPGTDGFRKIDGLDDTTPPPVPLDVAESATGSVIERAAAALSREQEASEEVPTTIQPEPPSGYALSPQQAFVDADPDEEIPTRIHFEPSDAGIVPRYAAHHGPYEHSVSMVRADQLPPMIYPGTSWPTMPPGTGPGVSPAWVRVGWITVIAAAIMGLVAVSMVALGYWAGRSRSARSHVSTLDGSAIVDSPASLLIRVVPAGTTIMINGRVYTHEGSPEGVLVSVRPSSTVILGMSKEGYVPQQRRIATPVSGIKYVYATLVTK
jgi:hypothetical protein